MGSLPSAAGGTRPAPAGRQSTPPEKQQKETNRRAKVPARAKSGGNGPAAGSVREGGRGSRFESRAVGARRANLPSAGAGSQPALGGREGGVGAYPLAVGGGTALGRPGPGAGPVLPPRNRLALQPPQQVHARLAEMTRGGPATTHLGSPNNIAHPPPPPPAPTLVSDIHSHSPSPPDAATDAGASSCRPLPLPPLPLPPLLPLLLWAVAALRGRRRCRCRCPPSALPLPLPPSPQLRRCRHRRHHCFHCR